MFSLLLAVAAADRLTARSLNNYYTCPNYIGLRHMFPDLQMEMAFLKAMSADEQRARYPSMEIKPNGALFGRVVVHFSQPLPVPAISDYFKVTKFSGDVIEVARSEDSCSVFVDFVVNSSCNSECIPAGVCLELDVESINQALDYDLPLRKVCKTVDRADRPNCLDASLLGLGMGVSSEGMAYTDKPEASVMVLFSSSFHSFVELTPEDFTVYGEDEPYIESVEAAMPGNPENVAYTIRISHGDPNGEERPVKVCFTGSATLNATGQSIDYPQEICAEYMTTYQDTSMIMPSVEIYKSKPAVGTCF